MLDQYKLLTVFIVFIVIYTIYGLFGDKPLFYPFFWRTVYYESIWCSFLALCIILAPLRDNSVATILWYGLIAYFGAHVVFHLALANVDRVTFYKLIGSRIWSLVFAGVAGTVLFIVSIVELFSKWNQLFK